MSTPLESPPAAAGVATEERPATPREQPSVGRPSGGLRRFFGHYLKRERVLGLDLLRIFAALTILIYHGLHFGTLGVLAGSPVAARVYTYGYLAVDVFFVLSGWLLTQQALRMRMALANGSFATFWARRWLRTLPPYVVGLIAALYLAGHVTGLRPLAVHALFLQTIWQPNLYPISWTLVTEEWFYLALPFAVIAAGLVRRRALVVAAALSVLAIPLVLRGSLLRTEDFLAVLMTPQARFDGLVIGAGLAAVAVRAEDWWRLLDRRRLALFGIGAAMIGAFLLAPVATEGNIVYRTVGLLIFCVAVGALIPQLAALRWPGPAPRALVGSVTLLSDVTYPLYLVHALLPHDLFSPGSGPLPAVLWLVMVFAAAFALHVAVERPFLALRARYFGSRPAARRIEC